MASRIRVITIKASPAVGGAGTSTIYQDSAEIIRGEIMGVYLTYLDSPPAGTTDVTLATLGVEGPPIQSIMSIANAATNRMVYPRSQAHDTAGAAISGEYVPILVADRLRLTIAQANVGDGVEAAIYIRE